MEGGVLYALFALPFFLLALEAWRSWARGGPLATFGVGVVLAALGIDAARTLLHLLGQSPALAAAGWVEPLVGLGIAGYVLHRVRVVWRDLGRPPAARRMAAMVREAEALAEARAAGPPEGEAEADASEAATSTTPAT